MPAKSDVSFVRFDPVTGAPRFAFDLGSNTMFQIDLATESRLFGHSAIGARTPQNFAAGARFTPGSAVGEYTYPRDRWVPLDAAAPAVYFRLVSFGQSTSSSVSLTNPTSAPSFYRRAPVLLSMQPNHGSTTGGTRIRIQGRYLREVTQVFMGTFPVAVLSISDLAVEIEAAPRPQPGPVDVTVQGPAGRSNALRFVYDAPGRALQLLDAFGQELDLTGPASFIIYARDGAVLQTGMLQAGQPIRYDQPSQPHRITLETGTRFYDLYFDPVVVA